MKAGKLLLVGLLFLSGCASINPEVKMNSTLNPDYNGRKYSRILVLSNSGSIGIQKELEMNLASDLKQKFSNLTIVMANEAVFPPATKEKLDQLAQKNNIQAILMVTIDGHKVSEGGSSTYGSVSGGENGFYNYEGSTYTTKYLTVSLESALIDVQTNERVWVNQSIVTVTGREIPALYSSLAKAIAKEFISTNLLSDSDKQSENIYDKILDAETEKEKEKIPEKEINLIDGFRSLKWGDSPQSNMTPLANKGKMVGYGIENVAMSVFGLDADVIGYYFLNNRFCNLDIIWGFKKHLSEAQFVGLRENIMKVLGSPSTIDATGDYEWKIKDQFKIIFRNMNIMKLDGDYYIGSLIVDWNGKQ